MTDTTALIRAALQRRGIADAAAFRKWYGEAYDQLTRAELLRLLSRIPLVGLPRPAGMDPDAWEQVTQIVDGVHEWLVAASIGYPVGPRTLADATIVLCPVLEGEDLYDFAVRFDTYARGLIAAAEAQAA